MWLKNKGLEIVIIMNQLIKAKTLFTIISWMFICLLEELNIVIGGMYF